MILALAEQQVETDKAKAVKRQAGWDQQTHPIGIVDI